MATIQWIEGLLAEKSVERAGGRADGRVEWEIKRRLVEILVGGIQVETIDDADGLMTNTVVHYRFAQPGQPIPVTLPRTYSGGVVRMPAELKTIGDHVRKRRIALKLRQRDVAERIGVDVTSVCNWEANRTSPEFRHMPAIIQLLGYNPIAEPNDAAERRTSLGLSQEEAAGRMGVDPSTLARWGRGASVWACLRSRAALQLERPCQPTTRGE